MSNKEKTLTSQEQEFLIKNFHVRHAQQGKTLQAAQLASTEYRKERGNRNDPESKYRQELAQQIVVLYHAAAYLEKSFVIAFPHLRQASTTALKAYPVGKSADEAVQKGKDWQGVYGDDPNGAFETMRTTVNLLATLREVVNDSSNSETLGRGFESKLVIDKVRSRILSILLDATKDGTHEHRALLLTALEYLPSSVEAQNLHVEMHNIALLDQQTSVTMLARTLKRRFDQREYGEVLTSLQSILTIGGKNSALWPQIFRDLAKAFGSNKQKRIQQWHKELRERPNTVDVIGLVEPWSEVTHISDGTNVWPLR